MEISSELEQKIESDLFCVKSIQFTRITPTIPKLKINFRIRIIPLKSILALNKKIIY